MARSHPPTLLTLVRRALSEECGTGPGDHVLIAVSGGGDSQALLHALGRLGPELGLAISAHGVDHGLRPEAQSELDCAGRLAARYNIPFATSRVSLEPGGNLQSRARAARYAALQKAAETSGARFLATAHHAEDRAETVLIRLLRGSGPRGLGVLPPRSGWLIRPMVRVCKSEIARHLRRHGIEYSTDPSNFDRRFLRVRVRLDLMPELVSLSPSIIEHLNALADQILEAPPIVFDRDGHQISLGRSQAKQLRRAQLLELWGASVRLPGGRELRFDSEGRLPRLAEPPSAH